jgi:hypothetical protein
MNLLQLKWYAVESARKNPTLHNEIYDFVQLAIDEIEEGGSEDHECSLAQRDIEFIVNELLIETEMEKRNIAMQEKTMQKLSYEELEERLKLANIQARIVFDLLHEREAQGNGEADEELLHLHNIKLLTDVSTNEWQYQD